MEEEKNCDTCKYRGVPPIGDPCKDCKTLERWEPKFIPDESPFPKVSAFTGKPVAQAVGIDPGAPEGDQTNVRLDWGESGPEMVVPPLTQDKVLGYAIGGIKKKVSILGLLLTNQTLSNDALANTILELQDLSRDWDRLEEEREALRKAGEHGNGND